MSISLTIACDFNHSDGDINIDLVDGRGNILVSANSETDNERIDCPVDILESYFLHVYFSSSANNSYTLYWETNNYRPNADLSFCMSGERCSQFTIDPDQSDTTYLADTLSVELLAGDKSIETLAIQNDGPGFYSFYSALDFPPWPDNANQAISFDGEDGYVWIQCANDINLGSSMTLEAWIMDGQGESGESPVMSNEFMGNGYDLYITGEEQERRLGFRVGEDIVHSKTFLLPDRWYHVAVTAQSGTICLYINGIMDTGGFIQESIDFVNYNLSVGTNHPTADQRYYFRGCIDELRIWDRKRTAWEIHSFMHRELTGQEPGLVGYWPMNMESANRVVDLASSNNGVMEGGAQWIPSSNPIVDLIQWAPEIGFIQRGSMMNYTVTFNAVNLKGGDYLSDILFISSDPTLPDFILPTRLHVTDGSRFSIQPDSISFGEFDLYKTISKELEVMNLGSQTLFIDSIGTDLVGSRITPGSAAIEPGGKRTFRVDVFMRYKDQFTGNIVFYTNDPSDLEVNVPFTGKGDKIENFYLIHTITDTVFLGYSKFHIWPFRNESMTHDLILKPFIVTYSLPEEMNDQMLRPDSTPGDWISTLLPDSSLVPPSGQIICWLTLNATGLEIGDYYAELILEWYNPFSNRGFIPIRMYVKDTVSTGTIEQNTDPLLLYPNPARDFIIIQSRVPGAYSVEVISMNGQVLQRNEFVGTSHQLDLTSLQKGMYFVTIRSKAIISTKKVIKL